MNRLFYKLQKKLLTTNYITAWKISFFFHSLHVSTNGTEPEKKRLQIEAN